jgi:AraC-like DNA-binding protein
MHLFKEQVGVPLRRYLLWHRILAAVDRATQGETLTEAAHASGLADSAHLSRAFREIFGLSPSRVLKNSSFIQVIACLG